MGNAETVEQAARGGCSFGIEVIEVDPYDWSSFSISSAMMSLQPDALVADVDGRTSDQLLDLFLRLTAERAGQRRTITLLDRHLSSSVPRLGTAGHHRWPFPCYEADLRFTYLGLLVPALAGCILETDTEELAEVGSELPVIDPCWDEAPLNVAKVDLGPGQMIGIAEWPYFVSPSCPFAVLEHELKAVVPKLFSHVKPYVYSSLTPSQCLASTSWERTYYKTSSQIFGYAGGAVKTRHGIWNIVTNQCGWVLDAGQFETPIPAGYVHKIRIHGASYVDGVPTQSVRLRYATTKMTY